MSGATGFSLVEIMITLVIFSVVVLGLAGLAYQVAKRGTRAADQTWVMGELAMRVDRTATIDYDSLDNLVRCDTTLLGTAKLIACITRTTLTARTSSMLIIVRTTVPNGRPDTVTLLRSKQRRPIPLR